MDKKSQQKDNRRHLEGVVTSRSGDKTIAVEVAYAMPHPVYKKNIKRTERYLVHDPDNSAEVGQDVVIRECRPMSARKRWIVVDDKKIEKGK